MKKKLTGVVISMLIIATLSSIATTMNTNENEKILLLRHILFFNFLAGQLQI